MKKGIILLILTVHTVFSFAQESTPNLAPENPRWGFVLGYFGEKVTNPGFQIGAERYLATTKNYQVLATLHYNYFGERDLYQAQFFNPRIGFRYTSNIGITAASFFGVGYIFRRFQYDQYRLSNDGNIVNSGRAGISSAVPNIAIELSYDFTRKTNLPIKFFARPSVQFYYPNGFVSFDITYNTEIGIIYIPSFKK